MVNYMVFTLSCDGRTSFGEVWSVRAADPQFRGALAKTPPTRPPQANTLRPRHKAYLYLRHPRQSTPVDMRLLQLRLSLLHAQLIPATYPLSIPGLYLRALLG
jgi:hypothetical protein